MILTQGFNQPNYQVVSRISESLFSDVKINVYPNPTTGIIAIKTEGTSTKKIYLDIISIDGKKQLQNIELDGTEKNVDLSPFSSGIYFLNFKDISDNNQTTYKILKSSQN
ncbi:MAG: T9SS type A sorting domain-containing protein [Sphingobacteriales bacterium]|nr:T9SS type A sorting domain-containing protein [Sphingobacteriales bacterium]